MSGLDAFFGEIRIFPYSFIPEGWLLCAGQTLQASQYEALYAVIGNQFGGDSRTRTFNLPNLIGMVAVGTSASATGRSEYKMNDTGGRAEVSLTAPQMPAHNHTLQRKAAVDPINGETAAPSVHSNLGAMAIVSNPTTIVNANVLAHGANPTNAALAAETIGPVGQGAAHNNQQPYLDLVYCICVDGDFPMRPE